MSISAEGFAYLAFPLWLLAATRLGPRAFLTAGIAAFLVLGTLFEAMGIELTSLTDDFGIVRIAAEFGLGVGIYLVLLHRDPLPAAGRGAGAALALAILAALAGLPEFVVVALLGVMLAGLADASRQGGVALLRVPFLVYLGRISYSTYMVHIAFVIVGRVLIAKADLTGVAADMAVLALIVAVHVAAILLHEAVERPGQRVVLRLLSWATRTRVDRTRAI